MDAEACISSQKLQINKEAGGAEGGLLTHRVWSLGWKLSVALKATHYVLQDVSLCGCPSEGEQHVALDAVFSSQSLFMTCFEFLFLPTSQTVMH